jgi:hypothetical protein
MLASAVLISSCCFVALLIEVSNLKSEMSNMQSQSEDRMLQNSEVQLDTVNRSLLGIMDELGE